MYLACPSEIIEYVRQNLERNVADTSQVDLHTIGLCFENPTDIKSFFGALERLFHLRSTGINEWLRTSRNIVRFRDHALQPEIVSRNRLDNIISGLLRSLENEVRDTNFERKFDNCILSSLYLLKRRRYEPDFLASDNNHFKRLDSIFSKLLNIWRNRLSARQFTIVSVTLKFLHQEANYDDLKGIMIEV